MEGDDLKPYKKPNERLMNYLRTEDPEHRIMNKKTEGSLADSPGMKGGTPAMKR